jgi:hypothetical protein
VDVAPATGSGRTRRRSALPVPRRRDICRRDIGTARRPRIRRCGRTRSRRERARTRGPARVRWAHAPRKSRPGCRSSHRREWAVGAHSPGSSSPVEQPCRRARGSARPTRSPRSGARARSRRRRSRDAHRAARPRRRRSRDRSRSSGRIASQTTDRRGAPGGARRAARAPPHSVGVPGGRPIRRAGDARARRASRPRRCGPRASSASTLHRAAAQSGRHLGGSHAATIRTAARLKRLTAASCRRTRCLAYARARPPARPRDDDNGIGSGGRDRAWPSSLRRAAGPVYCVLCIVKSRRTVAPHDNRARPEDSRLPWRWAWQALFPADRADLGARKQNFAAEPSVKLSCNLKLGRMERYVHPGAATACRRGASNRG